MFKQRIKFFVNSNSFSKNNILLVFFYLDSQYLRIKVVSFGIEAYHLERKIEIRQLSTRDVSNITIQFHLATFLIRRDNPNWEVSFLDRESFRDLFDNSSTLTYDQVIRVSEIHQLSTMYPVSVSHFLVNTLNSMPILQGFSVGPR